MAAIFETIFSNTYSSMKMKMFEFRLDFTEIVPNVPINYIPALAQMVAWRRPGYKPLSEAMIVSFLTHICVTRPQ